MFQVWSFSSVSAQSEKKTFLIGMDTQAYPAGIITGLRLEWLFTNQDSLSLRAAYNFTQRQDFGVHDNEAGGGAGGGLGYRHFLYSNDHGLFMGFRTDIWVMDIEWRDDFNPLNRPLENILLNPILNPSLPAELDVRKNPLWFLIFNPYADVKGKTKITIVQPTIEAGYAFALGKYWRLDVNVALGAEINTSSHGEAVGQGAILLWGFSIAHRL